MKNVSEAILESINKLAQQASSRSMSGETKQTAVIYDALSEGEVEGLVN